MQLIGIEPDFYAKVEFIVNGSVATELQASAGHGDLQTWVLVGDADLITLNCDVDFTSQIVPIQDVQIDLFVDGVLRNTEVFLARKTKVCTVFSKAVYHRYTNRTFPWHGAMKMRRYTAGKYSHRLNRFLLMPA